VFDRITKGVSEEWKLRVFEMEIRGKPNHGKPRTRRQTIHENGTIET